MNTGYSTAPADPTNPSFSQAMAWLDEAQAARELAWRKRVRFTALFCTASIAIATALAVWAIAESMR